METYIALLLFIVPGFIAQSVFKKLNHSEKNSNNLNETVSALIYSVFIILANYSILIISKSINISDFKSISNAFSSIKFVILYAAITIITSIYTGYLWNKLNPGFLFIINKIRNDEGKNNLVHSPSMLVSCLNDGKQHLLAIRKGDQFSNIGFLEKFDIIEGSIDQIALAGQEERRKLDISSIPIKTEYFALGQDIAILEYDIDKYSKKARTRGFLSFVLITTGLIICLCIISIICRLKI